MVIPDGYLPQPAFYQGFVEGFKVGTLLLNVILQVVDSCVKVGFKLSFYGGLKMYDLGGLRTDRC